MRNATRQPGFGNTARGTRAGVPPSLRMKWGNVRNERAVRYVRIMPGFGENGRENVKRKTAAMMILREILPRVLPKRMDMMQRNIFARKDLLE